MQELVKIAAGALIAVISIWVIVRITNRRTYATGVIALAPLLAIMVMLGEQRDEVLEVLNRIVPWLPLAGGTAATIQSAFFGQSYLDFMSRILHSERFCRWGSRAFDTKWVDQVHAEWKKYEVLSPPRARFNIFASLAMLTVGVVWLALR
jgi:hypothetical protein